MAQEQELLVQLCSATDLRSAKNAIKSLERDYLYSWRAVGDNEANYGLINIGSDPGSALIERVTNAIDAVVEREALRQLGRASLNPVPASPREAVDLWFRIPGGRVANLGDPAKRQPLADNVVVTLLDGDRKSQPSVRIRDLGVGLTPGLIPSTIMSLSGTNKIDKPYLAGAYGQGGSTVLAFSPDGTLIVSRRQPDLLPGGGSDVVAVTFARYEELDPAKNKNGRYAYLVTKNEAVPHLPASLLEEFEPGTSVVHFNLGIDRYSARLTQLTGSLWWLLQNALFDPILPIWAEETRSALLGGKDRERRTIAGNYTRLSDDKRDKVEHSDSVDVHLNHESGATVVKVNYWVVRSKDDGKAASSPIDSYVDPYQPIAYTYFGQTHGTDERRFTAERLQLPYLAKFLILQVELDHLLPAARRELLSSTRDRLKRTTFFYEMREAICAALSEDQELIRLNDIRKEELLAKHSDKDRDRMRQRFAQLMDRLPPGVDARSGGRGRDEGGRTPGGSKTRRPLEPLLTRDEPTYLRIANVQRPIPIRLDRHALIQLESDAPDDYLTTRIHAKLTMVSKPAEALVLESKSEFHGGRARLAVRPAELARAGVEGTLSVFLFTPDDRALSDEIPFRLETPPEKPTTGDKGRVRVKAPEPFPIFEKDWGELGWDESHVAEVKPEQDGGTIYVNADNRHLVRLLRSGGYQQQGIARMRNNFVLYVAFYAWARHAVTANEDGALQGKEFEDYQFAELDRAAQTVVHSIAAGSRLADEE